MGNWFCEPMLGEVSHEDILKKAENGEFHEWNFQPFDSQESGYEDVLEELKKYQAVDYLAYDTEYKKLMKEGKESEAQVYKEKMDAMVEDVLKIYRSKNIFPIQYFSDFGAMEEIQKCLAYNAKFDGNTVSCVTGDTMYFNGVKWKFIRDYTEGERVLQFNEDGTATLVKPEKYIHYQSEEPFYEYNSTVLSSAQTGSHDVVYWTKDGGYQKVSQENIKINEDYMIPITCIAEGGRVLSESILNAFVENGIIPEDIESLLLNKENRLYVLRKLFPEFKKHSRRLVVKTAGVAQCLHTMLIFSGERATVDTGRGYEVVWNSLNTYKKDEDIIKLGSGKYFGKYDDVSKGVREFRKIPASRSGFKDKYCFVVPSHMLVLMRHSRVYITGNCGAGIGTGLCRWLFPNIFDTPSAHDLNKKGAETQYKKFLNDTYLRRAIKFCYSYKNGCPTPTAVEGGLRLVGSAPSNFRPMNAKAVYERFTPAGGTIYDFCCVDGDTMFFDGYSWKEISKYKEGDRVLQFNLDGTAELVDPIEYIHYESDEPFYRYRSLGLSSCQTGNHDVVYFKNGEYRKIKQSEVKLGDDYMIPITCILDGGERVNKLYLNNVWEVLSDDLNSMEYAGTLDWCKVLLNKENRVYLIEKLFSGEDGYYTKDLEKAHFVYSLLQFTGEVARLEKVDTTETERVVFRVRWVSKDWGKGKDKKLGERSFFAKYESKNHNGKEFRKVYKKDKYCFVVSSHMLVLMRDGMVYVTGNCGFGGRMLGALTSKNNYRYVGTDPCTETFYHLNQLGEYIETVTGREDSYELHCTGSEDFRGPANSIDFAFSSPPYFNLEVYSDEETQCFNKFPVLEDWLEGYVRATIKNIKHMLKPGRFYAVNIADFKVGSGQGCAYVDEWIRISTEEGMPLFDTVYLGVTARAGSAEQAAGELKKENILIFKKPLW